MNQATHDAIKATALDYIDGWFEGDADRMRRALSPELHKCSIIREPGSGKLTVGKKAPAEAMVRWTREGVMKEANVPTEAHVLYVFRDIAIARTVCPYFEDLLHLANFEEYGWRIVHAIYQMTNGELGPDLEEQMQYWTA